VVSVLFLLIIHLSSNFTTFPTPTPLLPQLFLSLRLPFLLPPPFLSAFPTILLSHPFMLLVLLSMMPLLYLATGCSSSPPVLQAPFDLVGTSSKQICRNPLMPLRVSPLTVAAIDISSATTLMTLLFPILLVAGGFFGIALLSLQTMSSNLVPVSCYSIPAPTQIQLPTLPGQTSFLFLTLPSAFWVPSPSLNLPPIIQAALLPSVK
jgi:hypothetical protein